MLYSQWLLNNHNLILISILFIKQFLNENQPKLDFPQNTQWY